MVLFMTMEDFFELLKKFNIFSNLFDLNFFKINVFFIFVATNIYFFNLSVIFD